MNGSEMKDQWNKNSAAEDYLLFCLRMKDVKVRFSLGQHKQNDNRD